MILRLTTIGLLVATSHAVQAESLTEKLRICSGISHSTDRLACYDHIVPTNIPKTKSNIVANSPKPQAANTQFFGQEHKLRNTTPDKVNVKILTVKKSLRGKLKITLENGQEWHQTDSSYFRVNKEKETYIKKGALGSFYMGQVGRNKTMKVKRIK